ncbi:hypothetical protein OsJ_36587 [Oryza sativa Japonica Group]|uniref:DUF7851 domain-containing protein n=1 Tax=Oryza sativa subsp. japonica TaxID=39947 RepID=B9GDV6_ORYSJ|nr:hypothetical protein OsJ_36587 [Oryza sativa Japonica Group]
MAEHKAAKSKSKSKSGGHGHDAAAASKKSKGGKAKANNAAAATPATSLDALFRPCGDVKGLRAVVEAVAKLKDFLDHTAMLALPGQRSIDVAAAADAAAAAPVGVVH